jgi:hypothetical protein
MKALLFPGIFVTVSIGLFGFGYIIGNPSGAIEVKSAEAKGFNRGMDFAIRKFHDGKLLYAPEHEVEALFECILVQVVENRANPIKMEGGGIVSRCVFAIGETRDWDTYLNLPDGAEERFQERSTKPQE